MPPEADNTRATRERLFDVAPTPSVIDRHWFVPDLDDGTFCQACNLPRYNIRHVARPGAAA